jgi:hypothetical protein
VVSAVENEWGECDNTAEGRLGSCRYGSCCWLGMGPEPVPACVPQARTERSPSVFQPNTEHHAVLSVTPPSMDHAAGWAWDNKQAGQSARQLGKLGESQRALREHTSALTAIFQLQHGPPKMSPYSAQLPVPEPVPACVMLLAGHGITSRLGKVLVNLASWGSHREHCVMFSVVTLSPLIFHCRYHRSFV